MPPWRLFSAAFRDRLRQAGVEPVRLPRKSPNLNAFAERWTLSATSECLRRMIPLGENHLRLAVRELAEHYHRERNHHGLDHSLLVARPAMVSTGPVRCHRRLAGTLNFYHREAA